MQAMSLRSVWEGRVKWVSNEMQGIEGNFSVILTAAESILKIIPGNDETLAVMKLFSFY